LEADKIKNRARNNAYALLRQRPQSEFEIRRRLKLKGYGGDVIEGVIEDLRRSGEVDDGKFARLWVDSRMHSNPMGDVVLRHELKQKGVSDSIIEATLEDKAKNYDEYEVAFSMAKEQYARLKKLDRRKALKRIYDFLLRRGFKYDTIRKITDELIGLGKEDELPED
jgi:regulatory protein